MLLIDVLLRYPAITMLVITGVLALRDARGLVQGRIAALLCFALSAMLLTTAPEILRPPPSVYIPLRLFDTINLVCLWWFGLSLFEDDFSLRRLHWLGLAAYLVFDLPLRINFLFFGEAFPLWVGVPARIVPIAMIGHLFWTALAGRGDDLIESRRRIRVWYTFATAVAAALIIGGEITYSLIVGPGDQPDWLSTARVAIAFPAIAYGAYWLLHFRGEFLLFEPVPATPRPATSIDAKDRASHARLVAAMETDRLYREPGLSIGALAERIKTPEHQLRALINKGLGFRNFAAFLNTYRLAEAKAALADPERARLPILTIAMDVGYGSLATFNRAFKQAEGITPSEYRADALNTPAQS